MPAHLEWTPGNTHRGPEGHHGPGARKDLSFHGGMWHLETKRQERLEGPTAQAPSPHLIIFLGYPHEKGADQKSGQGGKKGKPRGRAGLRDGEVPGPFSPA